jgi:ornithine cyclodeaminase
MSEATVLLSDTDVRALLEPREALAAVRQSFLDHGLGLICSPPRVGAPLNRKRAVLLAMPASRDEPAALGVKLVTVFPENRTENRSTIHGIYILFDSNCGGPIMAMDAEYLTQVRTAAASAVATEVLYGHREQTVAIFGTGAQASAHALFFTRVLGYTRVLVVGRTRERANAFADTLSGPGILAEPVDARAALRAARVIVTATSSKTPVFDAADVVPGSHINAIGSFQPDAAELPHDLIMDSRVIVDTKDAVRTSGDLAIPVSLGQVTVEQVGSELSDVMLGRREGRRREEDVTIYKSVGTSFLDIAVAQLVLARAKGRRIGGSFAFTHAEALLLRPV